LWHAAHQHILPEKAHRSLMEVVFQRFLFGKALANLLKQDIFA
jgi:hypothetical protein